PCARVYASTSDVVMADGFASTPRSWTFSPALPSSSFASTMLSVVSGQTVVHSESSKDSRMTLPRNWLSDIGWPNWFVSRKSGAGALPRELPRSRFGFRSAAAAALDMPGPPDPPGAADDPDDEQPASRAAVVSAATAVSPALTFRAFILGNIRVR